MKAILRPRFAMLLALLALPLLFNSCTPYLDQADYGDAGYSSGPATVYHTSSNYYRPAHVPVVASRLYVTSSHRRCNVCSYNPCRCSSQCSYSSYYRPTQHGYRPGSHVVHAPSGQRGYRTSSHGRSSSVNHGTYNRGSSSGLHRNSGSSNRGNHSGISPRYTTTSTITPSPRRPAAVPTRSLKPQSSPRPTSTRFNAPTRSTPTARPTSRPTSRPTQSSRPTQRSRPAQSSRPTQTSRPTQSSRPSAPRQASTPAPAPAPTRRHSHSGVNPTNQTKMNGPSLRGKPRG